MHKNNEMNIIYRSENQQFHLFNQTNSNIKNSIKKYRAMRIS